MGVEGILADRRSVQPNPATQSHQISLWSNLILGWARHDRVFQVNVDSPEPGEVFVNKAIGREEGGSGLADARTAAACWAECGSRAHGQGGWVEM